MNVAIPIGVHPWVALLRAMQIARKPACADFYFNERSRFLKTMIDDKRLRELCARALQAPPGPAFNQAIAELARAIDERDAARNSTATPTTQKDS